MGGAKKKGKTDERAKEGVGLTGLRFESILMNAEQGLQLALDKARLESDHGLTIGEQAETAVRTVLRGYLPSGYAVGHGHVYDAYGDGSKETDVIITNPDHPLSFPEDRAGTYVVDGVSAAGEVKAKLDVGKLVDCIAKGTRFKKLRLTINDGDHVITPRHQKLIKQIGLVPPYFVVAFDSKIKPDTVCRRLQNAGLISPPEGKSLGPQDDGNEPQPPLTPCVSWGKASICSYGPKIRWGSASRRLRTDPDGFS